MAEVRWLVKMFPGLFEIAADEVMMSAKVCGAKSMLMTGAMLPGGAHAETTDECLLLVVSPVSRRLLLLGGRRSLVSDDVLAS